jgi:hypothetical protein
MSWAKRLVISLGETAGRLRVKEAMRKRRYLMRR